ncbi:hypothetical protein [Pseudomonas putida]|uniref:Uncharacterized protein n=2 Tax=Pseudomonas putida TaxID=303 RepID=A0AAD0LAA6_PSEPU|nr:hypothetical protein [Pseudomonas putida]AXA25695.1 hypothetical protein C1S65_16815 [Pseudomonas putida]
MIVKIGFSPASLKPEDEAYPAFQAGGLTLKFWALYKKSFITDQHFRDALTGLASHFERMLDIDDHEITPYTNIDEFVRLIGSYGIHGNLLMGPMSKELIAWVVRYWDCFNLSVQRQVHLQYKVVREVDEIITVTSFGTESA